MTAFESSPHLRQSSSFLRCYFAALFCLLVVQLLLPARLSAREFERSMQIQSFYAPAVERQLKYAVLLPSRYHNRNESFPVLYLLHGFSGSYRSWINYAKLPLGLANQLETIVVFVDAGNSCYVNWHSHHESKAQRWEDMVIQDLIPHVDTHYRTRAHRNARYIGGFSMGGFGAVMLALKHPKLFSFAFSSAGSLSFAQHIAKELRVGNVDWNQPERWLEPKTDVVDIPGFATQRERTPRGSVFVSLAQAKRHDPHHLLASLAAKDVPYLHLDVGIEDRLAPETRAFVAQLRSQGIAHSYLELPGAHKAPYWREAMVHTVEILRQHQLTSAKLEGLSDH